MSRWFRMYNEALDDPKVQGLPGNEFKGWVNLLCLACRNDGYLPSLDDIAFALRLNRQATVRLLKLLESRGLIDRFDTDDCYGRPHAWDERQFRSDTSKERVKRHRQRARNGECNVTSGVTVTAPDTETEAETESEADSQSQVEEFLGVRDTREALKLVAGGGK